MINLWALLFASTNRLVVPFVMTSRLRSEALTSFSQNKTFYSFSSVFPDMARHNFALITN